MLERPQTILRICPPVPIGQFTRSWLLVAITVRVEANLDGLNYGLHLRWQPAMTGSKLFAFALQVQMEFNGARAPCMNSAIKHSGADAVVGPTDRATTGGSQGLDGGQVAFVRWSGVAGDAVQQSQLGAAGVVRDVDGVLDLRHRGHARGEDQRLSGAGAGAD